MRYRNNCMLEFGDGDLKFDGKNGSCNQSSYDQPILDDSKFVAKEMEVFSVIKQIPTGFDKVQENITPVYWESTGFDEVQENITPVYWENTGFETPYHESEEWF